MKTVLAIDGGNSKTLAAVADEEGALLGLARGGGCNYQGIGRKAAAASIEQVVREALTTAGVEQVDCACYGIAGADRDKDFAVIRELIRPFDPAGHSVLVNDTLLALRAATPDGVGVALIGGAGSNCIGRDRTGRIRKAGGLGPLTGDRANGGALVLDAVAAAMKGVDGRGPRTLLEHKFKAALELEALEDVIEFEYFDSPRHLDWGSLAPLVFEAAGEGDEVAASVLASHGRSAGEAALAVLTGLFDPAEEVTLALGGSVLQHGSHPALVDAVQEKVRAAYPRVRFIVLDEHPLLGGLLRALDEAGPAAGPGTTARLKEQLTARLAES